MNIKKNFFILFFGLLCSCQNLNNNSVNYKSNNNNQICKLEVSNFELKSDIWSISKEGHPTSYIVGSFHARKKDDKLPDRIKKVIPDIDLVITESPLSENPKYSKDIKFKEYIDSMTYENPQLENIIGKSLYDDIVKFHEKNTNLNINFVSNNIDYVKPWFFIIELPRYLIRKNFTYDTGYESLIYLEADALKKQFDFLEDRSVLPSILSNIPNEHIIAQINRFIKYDDKISDDFNKIYKSFTNKKYVDLIKLENKNLTNYYDDKEEEQFWSCFHINELLINRNNDWNNKILGIISQKRTLIVVGFPHLFGKYGILDFLRSQGYKVDPVY